MDGKSQGFWDDDQSKNKTSYHAWKELEVVFKATKANTRIDIREAGDDINYGRGIRIDDIRVEKLLSSETIKSHFLTTKMAKLIKYSQAMKS